MIMFIIFIYFNEYCDSFSLFLSNIVMRFSYLNGIKLLDLKDTTWV